MNTGTRNYAIVTAAYWGFTLSDGALRMLVLLHFYRLGYSPFTLAFLFLLYEAMGVVANLIGGWLATRYGIQRMLTVGLATQITGFLLLSALSPDWTAALSVAWVVAAQGICGVAKDLTKTASKSAIKLTAGEASGQLFKWVAFFTGSKNAMKGVGFFLGGLLLQAVGFQTALWIMAALLAGVFIAVLSFVPPLMGKAKASKSAKELFAKNRGINLLAAARVALFGARDVWFVVGVPVFLYASGWNFTMVGGFLALWTIGYGAVQAFAPALVRRSDDGLSTEVPAARLWSALLAVVPMGLAVLVAMKVPNLEWVVVAGLGLFGFAFAVNSSVHSYLILAYAGSEKAAEDVGFYYAANALGRFFGTLMSGLLYQWGGLMYSLIGSALMLTACWLITLALPVQVRRAAPQALPDAATAPALPELEPSDASVRVEAPADHPTRRRTPMATTRTRRRLMDEQSAVSSLAALAQGMRLRIFRALVGAGPQGLTPGALSLTLDVPGSTLSFHLKELMHAGMVSQVRDGRNLIYRPSLEQMNALLVYLTAHCCQASDGASCEASSPPGCSTC